MKRKLLRCMTALSAVLFASCTSELALEGVPQTGVDGEEVEVTFSVSALSANSSMRNAEVGGPGQWQKYIGRGQEIDMLIYAVYEYDSIADKFTLLKQYGKGLEKFDGELPAAVKAKNETDYDGQTIRSVTKGFPEPETITLRLMRNKEYHIAFWAQSSQTTAYNTDNLEEVKVSYDEAQNNDETRDAFCKVESFSVSAANSIARNVILTRPLAQINVGTTGADYNYQVRRGNNKKVTRSRIKLTEVAQCFNVVRDQVIVNDTYPLKSVTFEFATIPAYIQGGSIPTDPTQLVGGEKFTDDETKNNAGYRDTSNSTEEFLRVNLDGDTEIKDYKITYPTVGVDADKNSPEKYFLTETFKYLSMCYVLVQANETQIPNYDDAEDEPTEEETEDSEVVDRWNSTLLTVDAVDFDETGDVDYSYTSISNLQYVPVHRNWRTNILCGLYHPTNSTPSDPEDPDPDPEDPDNPSDPDDPTSIVKAPMILVTIAPAYDNDHTTTDNGSTWTNWTNTSQSTD